MKSSLAYRVSAWNRWRKWRLFNELIRPGPDTTVLDVGFQGDEYSMTDNFIEKHYPYPGKLTALGVDEPEQFRRRYPEIKAIHYGGGVFPFGDREFDVCWSNAVLEHVGSRAEQLLFVREIRRVAKHGFFTTPNRRFPVEVHTRTPFLHFLPTSWFEAYLRTVGKEWATGPYMRLLTGGELTSLLREAGFKRGEFRIIRHRLVGFTMEFIVVF